MQLSLSDSPLNIGLFYSIDWIQQEGLEECRGTVIGFPDRLVGEVVSELLVDPTAHTLITHQLHDPYLSGEVL